MTPRTRLAALATLLACSLLLAGPAAAETKVYNSTAPGGVAGDRLQNSPDPEIPPFTPNVLKGRAVLDDAGAGTVTMSTLEVVQIELADFDTTGFFGPGSFIFIDNATTASPAPGQTGSGSTAKSTGSVTWGIIGGWTGTGVSFCISSPPSTCTNSGFTHGMTEPTSGPASSTFDMGTWSFDAEGDYEASPYIQNTQLGGASNTLWELRGTFVGAGIPALPLVGLGAVAAALLAHGIAAVRRRK